MGRHQGAAALSSWFWSVFDGLYPLNLLIYAFLWPLLELLFLFRVRRFLCLRSAQEQPHDASDQAECERFWDIVLGEYEARRDRTEELKEILRGWYLGEGEVQSDNLEDLISWTLSASSPAGLSPAQRRLTSAVVERTQRALGCNRLPAGRNPNLECMAHTLGPLAPCWKPLLFYLVVHVARSLSGALLGACGFELRRQGPLEYWFHPATARPTNSQADSHVSDGALPLVVLHGVGGLTGYLPLLLRIRSLQPEWPLIVPLFPQCSLPLPSHDPSPLPADHIKLTLDAIVAMIARHSSNSRSSPRAAFLAHSLGTAVFASLCKAHPTVIGPSLLADPICFLLYRRDVLHNFLYRKPRPLAHLLSSHGHGLRGPNALHLGYWFRLAIHAVLTQEPTIQSCFRREFWWTRHWLHPSDLPADALVVLSGRDAIVPSHKVRDYLQDEESRLEKEPPDQRTRPQLQVAFKERWHHGFLIVHPLAQRQLVGRLNELLVSTTLPRTEAYPIGAPSAAHRRSRNHAAGDCKNPPRTRARTIGER